MTTNFKKFSESDIWSLQRRYFAEAGIDAWKDGEVPHYVTSNPRMAETYANLIIASIRDLAAKKKNKEPLYILELGAGSGRFSYHLLHILLPRLEQLAHLQQEIIYVMSDFVEDNLLFWQQHPRLKPYFEKGCLDIAFVDAEKNTELELLIRKKKISPGSLAQPLIVIANYFFDSIPQELFYFESGNAQQVLASVKPGAGKGKAGTSEMKDYKLQYAYEVIKKQTYADALQKKLFNHYRETIFQSHVLFPHIGMDCISRLQQLSKQGLILFTADKGFHRLDEWQNKPAPQPVSHGSFSLSTNYHALKFHCEEQNGKALFPKHPQSHINVGCLLYTADHEQFQETKLAYEAAMNDFGPDEYFSIKKHIEKQFAQLLPRELFAYLRLSAYDARFFSQLLPELYAQLPSFTTNERYTFLQITAKVWDGYYPIGEKTDLALQIATALQHLSFYKEAITFFQLSEKMYGKNAQSLHKQALCYLSMEKHGAARQLLNEALTMSPGNKEIIKLSRTIEKQTL